MGGLEKTTTYRKDCYSADANWFYLCAVCVGDEMRMANAHSQVYLAT